MSWTNSVVICKKDGCEREHPAHKWGNIRANADGWYHDRNGSAWCPEHRPSWVMHWRKK